MTSERAACSQRISGGLQAGRPCSLRSSGEWYAPYMIGVQRVLACGVHGAVLERLGWLAVNPQAQLVCLCCARLCPSGCAASPDQSTGACAVQECRCYGTKVDGGLCEGCYLWTK